jgi:hypothetical protein
VTPLRDERLPGLSDQAPRHDRRAAADHPLGAVQRRLDENAKAMRRRRETVEHPFGTIKARRGSH